MDGWTHTHTIYIYIYIYIYMTGTEREREREIEGRGGGRGERKGGRDIYVAPTGPPPNIFQIKKKYIYR